jgi:hypothetical protein
MKTVSVRVRSTKISIDKLWQIMIDIEKYPQRVKFVRSTTVYGKIEEGAVWDDTTTILWFPLRLKHVITDFKKNSEYSFDLPLHFGGWMRQRYTLKEESSKAVIITGTITYDLGNPVLNVVFSSLLGMRLKNMLESSVQFVDGEVI